jgi:hypothetical protein
MSGRVDGEKSKSFFDVGDGDGINAVQVAAVIGLALAELREGKLERGKGALFW